MSDNPFDRTILNPLEKPLSRDNNRMGSSLDRSVRFLAKSLFSSVAGAPTSGFIANGFNPVEDSPAAMSVVLKTGLGFQDLPGDVPSDIDTIVGLNDLESYKPLPLLADLVVPITAAPAGPSSRIDIIEVRADRLTTDSQSRQVFDNALKTFQATPVNKTLEFLLDGSKLGSVTSPAPSTDAISVKIGVPGTPGVAPTPTAGYVQVAEVFVDGDVVAINDADITDSRTILASNLAATSAAVFGVQTKMIPASLCQKQDGGGGSAFYNSDVWYSDSGNLFHICVPISGIVPAGSRLLSVRLYCKDTVGNLVNCEMFETPQPGAAAASVSDNVDTDNSGVAQSVDLTTISFNGGTNILEDDHLYYARVIRAAAPSLIQFYGARVTYETPQ